MRFHRSLLIVLSALAVPGSVLVSPAVACEPCSEIWDFARTAAVADLILVARENPAPKPTPPPGQPPPDGPDSIKIDIEQVLKGEESRQTIVVNSWDGMCPYGIQLEPGSHVVLLRKRNDRQQWDDVEFDSLNNGCALKSLPIKDGKVELEGKSLTLDELRSLLPKAGAPVEVKGSASPAPAH